MSLFFFFNDTATTEIYTLSLHDALPILAIFFGRLARGEPPRIFGDGRQTRDYVYVGDVVAAALAAQGCDGGVFNVRSEEHTSELQSRQYLVCRLLLEKKKKKDKM